jgi:hypothetical protein
MTAARMAGPRFPRRESNNPPAASFRPQAETRVSAVIQDLRGRLHMRGALLGAEVRQHGHLVDVLDFPNWCRRLPWVRDARRWSVVRREGRTGTD